MTSGKTDDELERQLTRVKEHLGRVLLGPVTH